MQPILSDNYRLDVVHSYSLRESQFQDKRQVWLKFPFQHQDQVLLQIDGHSRYQNAHQSLLLFRACGKYAHGHIECNTPHCLYFVTQQGQGQSQCAVQIYASRNRNVRHHCRLLYVGRVMSRTDLNVMTFVPSRRYAIG